MILGFVMALITRNINGICVLLLPCMGFDFRKLPFYLTVLKKKPAIAGLILSISLLFSMFYLWYLNTGYWLIDSYPNEFFNWSKPEIIKSLFSAHKGWFFFTPIALLGVLGLFIADKKIRLNGLLVLSLVIYLTSAWGSWDYGSGFSLRAYIDWYLLLGVGLGFLITKAQFKTAMYTFVITIGFIFSAINVLFSVQFMRGIISGHSQGIEYTVKNFFRLRPIMEFKVSKKIILQNKIIRNNFNELPEGCSVVNEAAPYSGFVESGFPPFFKPQLNFKIRYGGEINLESKTDPVYLCASLMNEKDSILLWQQSNVNDFVLEKITENVESGFDIPLTAPLNARIRVFFWLPKGKNQAKIDNLYIEFLETGFE
jgi:hypothetical protein